MKNKILVELVVPEINTSYDVFIPVNKKIGTVIELLNKALGEVTEGAYVGSANNFLYNSVTKERYNINALIFYTDIRNGTKLILI